MNSITLKEGNEGKNQASYIIFFFAVALYINTCGNGYAVDDGAVLVHAKQGLAHLHSLLTNDLFSPVYGQPLDIGIRWRPFTLFISALEYTAFGDSPFIGHLINVILYGCIGLTLFSLLSAVFSKNILIAFVAAILFIAHPIHSEVVANIKSRDELFSLLFLLLSLLFLYRSVLRKNSMHQLCTCLLFALAILSKENGIAFIAVIPAFLFCFTAMSVKQSIRSALPYIGITLLYLGLRSYVFNGFIIADVNQDILENQFYGLSFVQKLANVSAIFGKYIGLLLFPHPLSCDYSFNQIPLINWADTKAILSALVHLCLLAFAVKNLRKSEMGTAGPDVRSVLSFCILFYLITMSMVSNLVFNIGTPLAERFLFMPSLGYCLAVAVLALRVLKIAKTDQLVFPSKLYIPFTFLLAAFSFKTVDRNKDWKNNMTLFSHDAQIVTNSAKIHYYLGGEILEACTLLPDENPQKASGLRKALAEQNIALNIYPHFYVAEYTKGRIYEELHLPDSAIWYYEKVTKTEPRYADAYGKLGLVYGKVKGDPDKAIAYFQKGLQYKPDNSLWGLQLGVVYGMKGRYADAIKIFEHVEQMDAAKTDECDLNIGTAYFYSGNYKEALNRFQLLNQADPQNKIYVSKLGETYRALGDTGKAQEYFLRAKN